MRIAITGASGFVGKALATRLELAHHTVIRLARRAAGPGSARWDPATGEIDRAALGAIDAIVHLAGENVAGGRWSTRRRQAIADSRGPATERLCKTLASLPTPPRVLVSASAIGIYGDRADELLDEQSLPGRGFLADVGRAWEAGTAPATAAGIRVVNLRIGMVLDRHGGALAKMLPAFRFGLGGRLGSGRQWISWISRQDLLAAIEFALDTPSLRGPVLAVSPHPVTNREFTLELGRALRRPTVFPAPAFALRLLFGEMADALLLTGQRAMPKQLTAAGFVFSHPELGSTLRELLAPQ